MSYLSSFNTRETPQTEPVPTRNQVKNSAGGYGFQLDNLKRLHRFLILGNEGGTYYASERQLTRENAENVIKCVQENGIEAVNLIVEISDSGRAPKNDPAIFALAIACSFGDAETKKYAFQMLPRVCRIGTHLFHFAQYVNGLRGWGRGLREGIANWYEEKTPSQLAYQVVKYQSRDSWSHRDLLRKTHPKTNDPSRNAIYKWVVDGEVTSESSDLSIISAFEAAKKAETVTEIVGLIKRYNLPRECIPTQFLTDASVWEALLERMPMMAMIRNLATMTKVGILAPFSDGTSKVLSELSNVERIRESRLHPITILSAYEVYRAGRGIRSDAVWTPVQQITDALDAAFYTAFGNVESTGKRFILGLDISGSMGVGVIAGVPGLTPRNATAALALVTAKTEPNFMCVGFSHNLIELDFSRHQSLGSAIKMISGLPFGGTDCSLPMEYARKKGIPVDMFVTYTDNETWAGRSHPFQSLKNYRQQLGINAKNVFVGMTATGFSIADPSDPGMLDIVGFDTATPQLISDYARDSF